MLVVEGTYENGELHLDAPVAYSHPVRVRVEFLDDLSAAVRLPVISDPSERARRLHSSWQAAQAIVSANAGSTLSQLVVAAREEEV